MTHPVLAHDLEQQRAVHLLQHGRVVEELCERRLGVFLASREYAVRSPSKNVSP